MPKTTDAFRRRVAEWMARPMFCLSLTFLIVIAIMLVLWVDVPFFMAPHEEGEAAQTASEPSRTAVTWILLGTAVDSGYHCLLLLVMMWPWFIMELVFLLLVRDRLKPFWRPRTMLLVACLCPPLRMCARNEEMGGDIWFPAMGWRTVDRKLRGELEKRFSLPMIFIALAILPVLLFDLFMKEQVMTRPWLQIFLHASTGVIWFAFAAEFIVMVSVAKRKLRYCKEHWLDMAIILLPFISFLRTLRVVRASRVARLAKIQQLSKMGRLYRLRGLVLRAMRALMILELFNRLFRIGPERRLKKLRTVLEEKEQEIDLLRQEITRLEGEVAEKQRMGSERH